MGLFSTLLASNQVRDESSTGDATAITNANANANANNAAPSSLSLPTVLQLYTDDDNAPFVLDPDTSYYSTTTTQIPSFAPLTFQAVQVQALAEDAAAAATADGSSSSMAAGLRKHPHNNKHLHHNVVPDLGVWNCRVSSKVMIGQQQPQQLDSSHKKQLQQPLVDSLLMIPTSTATSAANTTFCCKVDLTIKDLSKVEPAITAMQNALVRHLILLQQQHSPDGNSSSSSSSKRSSSSSSSSATTTTTTATTSLYQLRTVQFGLAAEQQEESSSSGNNNKNEHAITAAPISPADHDIKIALQFAVLWPSTTTTTSSSNSSSSEKDDSSSSSYYQRQQTLALLYYHLRRYAAALKASLVFVSSSSSSSSTGRNNSATGTKPETTSTETTTISSSSPPTTTTTDLQPLLSLPQLAAIWRALAQGELVWKESVWKELFLFVLSSENNKLLVSSTNTTTTTDSGDETGYLPIYGPDSATDLIETVLRRNANYPGHWDAATDSVWKILPSSSSTATTVTGSSSNNNNKATLTKSGDQGWLKELRDSVAIPTETAVEKTPNKPTTKATTDKTPDVSDYFSQFLK